MESTKLQYHTAGPIQCPLSTGAHEKQPITAAARIVLYLLVNSVSPLNSSQIEQYSLRSEYNVTRIVFVFAI